MHFKRIVPVLKDIFIYIIELHRRKNILMTKVTTTKNINGIVSMVIRIAKRRNEPAEYAETSPSIHKFNLSTTIGK